MVQSRSSRGRHRQAAVSQLVAIGGGLWRVGVVPPPTLSRQAKVRLAFLDWHAVHGGNVCLTCRRFGISRPTFYRWRGRYEPRRLESLEDRPSRPLRRRRPSWTLAELLAVRRLRETYPRWAKEKLAVLLRREGICLSVSMVGRILDRLRRGGQLPVPARARSARKRRRAARPYAVRKPADYAVTAPGDLVELDTLDVRPVAGVVLKQFTARDLVSRWDVLDLHERATAKTAEAALDADCERMPFGVRALQVDGGSEFMAGFEEACHGRGIALFELPPRSPELNGSVERANRTHTEEFHECSSAEPTVAALGAELRVWETVYNTVRPHQALGYLTPAEFLASVGIDV